MRFLSSVNVLSGLGLGFGLGVEASLFGRQATSSSATVKVSSSTSSAFTLATPSSVATVNSSNHDLSQHFCRLWRHSSVMVEGKIYVDGGNMYIPTGNTTYYNTDSKGYTQGMNTGLVVIDLSKNFTNQDATPYTMINKGPQVPNAMIEGTLWWSAATRKIYQVGGWFSFNSLQDPGYIPDAALPKSSIWEFDVDTKTWAQSAFNLVNTGSKLDRPGAAANCNAPSLNMSFVFEGYVQFRSDYDYRNWTRGGATTFKYLEGMLQLDTNTSPPTLTNISVPTYVGPRMNGAMVHIPIGKKGIIVQIAGQQTMNPTPWGIPIEGANQQNTAINNTYVDIYDIESGFWFRQDTFGVPEIPTARADICVVMVPAADSSSYNIYMIAGTLTYNNPIVSEEMWVLTLPTFQWVKVHTRPGGIYGHTCHVVGENLVVVGGMQTNDQGGNINNCSTHMPAEIFSLTQMEYTGIYDVEGAKRTPPVPAEVVSVIGGTSTGGAVNIKPYIWSDLYLQYVFNPALTRPAYTPPSTYILAAPLNGTTNSTTNSTTSTTPKSTSPPSPVPIGAIVGGVLGGIALIVALIVLTIILLRRKRAAKEAALFASADLNVPPPQPMTNTNELPTYQDSKHDNAVEVSAYQQPLVFSSYQPVPAGMGNAPAVEMYAGESQDRFPDTNSSVGGSPRAMSAHARGGSPGLGPMGVGRGGAVSPSRFSDLSFGTSAGGSPSLEPSTPATPGTERASPALGGGGGRMSRQSEVSRSSVGDGRGGLSPRLESGRLSRQSEVSGASEP